MLRDRTDRPDEAERLTDGVGQQDKPNTTDCGRVYCAALAAPTEAPAGLGQMVPDSFSILVVTK
jgi:hypothetical protein